MPVHPIYEMFLSRRAAMTGKGNGTPTTDLRYPMVDLFTGAIMPLMYLNALAACYLMLLKGPWLFMEKSDESGQNRPDDVANTSMS
jgi:hypothetical protein